MTDTFHIHINSDETQLLMQTLFNAAYKNKAGDRTPQIVDTMHHIAAIVGPPSRVFDSECIEINTPEMACIIGVLTNAATSVPHISLIDTSPHALLLNKLDEQLDGRIAVILLMFNTIIEAAH